MAQEEGRLECFRLGTARDTSEHSHSLAREAEHVLNVAEVVAEATAKHCHAIEVYEHPATTSTELFVSDKEDDKITICQGA